jgi:NifU-like protein
MHCSVMGREALEAAMIDHYKRLGRGVPCHLMQQETILCHCFQVTKDTVRDAIYAHRLEEIEDVTNFTKAGGGCTDCHHDIGDMLRDCWDKIERGEAPAPAPLVELGDMPATTAPTVDHDPADAEIVGRIRELLTEDIAVALRNDGGDVEFVRYREGRVYLRLVGNCAACRSSDATIKGLIEPRLKEFVGEDLEVIEVDK